jgi:hypothetical protein
MATLLLATATYYCLIVLVGGRWKLGETEDGSPTGFAGLPSVGRALGFWIAASVCAGLLLGWLGHAMANEERRRRSIAAGAVMGLLVGEGGYVLFHSAFIWIGPFDGFIVERIFAGIASIVLGVAIVAVLLLWSRRPVAWSLFVLVGAISICLSIGLWHLVQSARLIL